MSAKVLVVDDDAGSLAALADILSLEGYRVQTMSNGLEALEYLREADDPPSVIILDLFMPVMDGWQFLAETNADPRLSQLRIPVVVVTALNAKVEAADAVIRKPIDLERLLHTLKTLEKAPPRPAH
jgi:two-component system response regulator CpxR